MIFINFSEPILAIEGFYKFDKSYNVFLSIKYDSIRLEYMK